MTGSLLQQCTTAMCLVVVAGSAIACSPIHYKSEDERIAAHWNAAEGVFVANVQHVEKFENRWVAGGHSGITPMERVRFRVERVFKGKLRPGDEFVTVTNLTPGSCGKSAVNDPVWLEIYDESVNRELPASREMFRRWLVFHWPNIPPELSDSSEPLELAVAQGDIERVEKLQASSEKR